MSQLLDSSHTWFFDALTHKLGGALCVQLTEGIKGTKREFVEVGDTKLGPYFPVRVGLDSKRVEVIFPRVLCFFAYDESFDSAGGTIEREVGRFLARATASSFRDFSETFTSVASIAASEYEEYVLRCEDRIFHVLSTGSPDVRLLGMGADMSMVRTSTWSAS